MSYTRGLALVAIACTLLTLGASGWLVAIAGDWASDDMHVGHGNSGFPPQPQALPRPGGQQ